MMHHPDLIAFIQAHLAQQTRSEEIVRELEKVGWSREDIDRAFGQIRNTSQSTHSAQSSKSIEEQLEAIQTLLKAQGARLDALESKARQPLPVPFHAEMVRDIPVPTLQESKLEQTIVPTPDAPHESIESKITGKGFAVIGIIALLVGVAFFLKYAFDNNWIGVTGRLMMGFMAGLGLLISGDFLHQKPRYRQYSVYLSGGGLAMLYLTIFAGTYVYELINPLFSIVLTFVVNIAGVVLALRAKEEGLAALAIFGGFLTPFLFGFGLIDHQFTFTYAIVLDTVVIAISFFQKWRKLYLLSFLGSYAIFFGWYAPSYSPESLGSTMLFLTTFYILFLIAPLLPSFMRREQSDTHDIGVIAFNSLCYFWVAYAMLDPFYHPVMGFFFVLWAVIALGIAVALRSIHPEDRMGVALIGGVGLVLATLAIPVQLTDRWITIAWAVEGAMLTWIGIKLKDQNARGFALLVLVIAVIRLWFIDSTLPGSIELFIPLLNVRFATTAITAASLFVCTALYIRNRLILEPSEQKIASVLAVFGNLITLGALSTDLLTYFGRRIALLYSNVQQSDIINMRYGMNDTALMRLRNLQNVSLSILWAMYASVLMSVGILKHVRLARIFSLVLFAIVIFKVFLVDSSQLSEGYRIFSFIALGLILLGISFIFYRYKDKVKEFILSE